MRNKEKKKEKRSGGGREGLLRKQNSHWETHTETQKRTGAHMPTERHARIYTRSPPSPPAPLFPVFSPALAQPGQVTHRHRNLAFLQVLSVCQAKANHGPASNLVLATQELCGLE